MSVLALKVGLKAHLKVLTASQFLKSSVIRITYHQKSFYNVFPRWRQAVEKLCSWFGGDPTDSWATSEHLSFSLYAITLELTY
jgi:hypothetical protein